MRVALLPMLLIAALLLHLPLVARAAPLALAAGLLVATALKTRKPGGELPAKLR